MQAHARRKIRSPRNCDYDIGIREKNGGSTEYAWLGRKWSMPDLQILVDAVSAVHLIGSGAEWN